MKTKQIQLMRMLAMILLLTISSFSSISAQSVGDIFTVQNCVRWARGTTESGYTYLTCRVLSTEDNIVEGYWGTRPDPFYSNYLTEIEIPDFVTYNNKAWRVSSVGVIPLYHKDVFSKLILPELLDTIGDNAFNGFNYRAFEIEGAVAVSKIGVQAFTNDARNTSFVDLSHVEEIGKLAFAACDSLHVVLLPSIKKMGPAAFQGSGNNPSHPERGLYEVELGNELEEIPDSCFQFQNIVTLTMPSKLKTIGVRAFNKCKKLSHVELPSGLTKIKDYAFNECSGLTSVNIPSSVTSIGTNVFYNCNQLVNVTSYLKNPVAITENTFSNRTNATLYVPYGCKAKYQAANYWKEFKEIIEMDPVITDLSELSNNKLYTFTSKRGRIIRKSDGSGLQGESARDDETEADTRFAILKIDGAYYLYSPVDKKFFLSGIEDGGEFKRYTASPISFDDTHPDGDYLWVVNTTDPNGNTMCFNYNGTYKIEINTWGVTTGMFDDGNRWIITAVSDFDPTEALEQFETDISISLNQELLSLSIGESASLTASILPSDADLTVQWSSSNSEVASVNNGVVTAIAAGNATITATTNEVTNLTATCEVTVTNGSVDTGDANGDGGVNVADYMAIANYILGVTVANFNATAADVNSDGDVNVTDYVGVANIILYGNYQGNVPNAIMALNAESSSIWMDIEYNEDGNMILLMHDAKPFAAFQMDIRLPEGFEIVGANMAKANQTKNLGFTRLQDGTWRLLYGTLENKAVNLVDDNLLTLELASNKTDVDGFVVVDDIFVTDRYASTLRLNAVQNGLPTGFYSIERGMVVNGDCYDLSGRKVDNSQLKKGVYIINGKKIIK